ncbi:MAG: arabinosidase [Prevotella sp.]|nr:arabinosidase [Prevotella sp.]
MKPKTLLISTLLLSATFAQAQVKVDIYPNTPGAKVSPNLYGIFYEDINHAADGGLYAELIRNRSFEDNDKAADSWKAHNGATMHIINDARKQLNKAQKNFLEVSFTGKENSGISNEGFWGINAVQGRTYKLSFWAKGKLNGKLKAYLSCNCGKNMVAYTEINEKITNKWKKYSVELTASANNEKARLWITSDGKGTVDFDVVSLFPPTFNNRENGMRPDLASMLKALHPKFFRFPGGCFVEGQNSPDNAFRWERTIGPIEQRPGHWNVNWGYRTTDGIGFDEYLQLAEDLGAKPLYVVNVGIWHGGFTPVDSIQPWIDETLNALEYANGDVTTKYGALRAKNGHPAPYNIEYIEIGNENNQDDPTLQSDNYYKRFKLFRDAILARYPQMHIVGNVVAWGNDNPKWNSTESVELLDEHYYRNPAWFANNFNKYNSYPRGNHGIYVGEYAVTQGYGINGSLDAALGEAVFMMGMENNSDVVKMASYAPIFANLNDLKWRPDMIQFNHKQAFGTPSYYVQKLMADNIGTRILKVEQHNPYTADIKEKTVAPEKSNIGFATWATQASFELKEINGKAENITFAPKTGQWQQSGNIYTQTANDESCLNIGNITLGNNSTIKLRARKDSGAEGFMLVFNYIDENNYCWLNFGGWGNTQHGIEQIVNGAKMQIATKGGCVKTGRWYDITLQQNGDSLKAWLDNELIFETKLIANTTPGLFTTATLDETTGKVIVKIANTNSEATTCCINLNGYNVNKGNVTRLTAPKGTDENSIEHPTRVYPVTETLSPVNDKLELHVPAYSLNIVTLNR